MGLSKRLERWGRRRAAALLNRPSCHGRAELPAEPSAILVIRTDSRLGNLVLLEPLLRSLRERFPGSALRVLTSHVFADLLRCQGYEVVEVDKKEQIRKPWRLLDLAVRLSQECYDVAIDAAHPHSFSLSGAVSTMLSRAPARISTDAGESPGWYTLTVPEPPLQWHESRALHSLGSLWDHWPAWSPPRLTVPSAEPRDAVGLHVGASGAKEYPREKMERLVERICRRFMVEVYWGSEREREMALGLGDRFPVAVMPRMDVPGLLRRLAGLRMFVTADNGPMHAASALSVPVAAMFRVDNSARFAPLSNGSLIFTAPDGPDPDMVSEAVLYALGCY